MSNWREQAVTMSQTRPVLNEKRVQIKEGVFGIYDKVEKKLVPIEKEITGAWLGEASALESFDKDYGKNGGSYFSPYIFDYSNVVLFDPKGIKVYSGDYEGAKAFLSNKNLDAKLRKVLFILTTDGIHAIATNISIAIDQVNSMKPKFGLNFVTVNIETYSTDSNVSNKTKEMLGKLAQKNPPTFANITIGSPITDEWAEANNLFDMRNLFKTYSEYYQKNKAEEKTDDTSELPAGLTGGFSDVQKQTDDFNNKNENPVVVEDEDLPF